MAMHSARDRMSKWKQKQLQIAIDPDPKGERRAVGGAKYDDWNNWLGDITAAALPPCRCTGEAGRNRPRLKYLAHADKAARTGMMLTERLDHHRNQGKQQIVVQHTTTVNADQAVITDSLVTGCKKDMRHPSCWLSPLNS